MIKRLFLLALCCAATVAQAGVPARIIPAPLRQTNSAGEFVLPAHFSICTAGLPDSLKSEALFFAREMEEATGKPVRLTRHKKAPVQVIHQAVSDNPEAYHLQITSQGIQLKAGTTAGFFYGFQTLRKLLPPYGTHPQKTDTCSTYHLPLTDIQDEPRFIYRGFMLDVARHFFTIEEVKRVLDIMAAYKMNKLHLHLSDDQGFRLEVKGYPKLNTIGSVRDYSYATDFKGTRQRTKGNQTYGPYYYSRRQIRELVEYARHRHIDLIPEIDMPGHFAAALSAYPEFSCTPRQRHSVLCDESHTPSILNVVNPQAIQFAKDILDEVMNQFPYPYIHIGGDECTTSHWENNEECRQFMQQHGFSHYRQLQSYFTKTLADHVRPKGYRLMVWNEAITAPGSDLQMMGESGVQVICWTQAEKAARKAAEMGLPLILAPQPTYYINRLQTDAPGEPAGPGKGTETLKQVYAYNPANNVGQQQLPYYKGIQACMWTEYIASPEHLEYMMLPRLIAVAESAWSQPENKDFAGFLQRLRTDRKVWDLQRYTYGPHYLLPE